MTGNHTFSTKGWELRHWDDKGVPHIITDSSEMTFTVEGKVIVWKSKATPKNAILTFTPVQ